MLLILKAIAFIFSLVKKANVQLQNYVNSLLLNRVFSNKPNCVFPLIIMNIMPIYRFSFVLNSRKATKVLTESIQIKVCDISVKSGRLSGTKNLFNLTCA